MIKNLLLVALRNFKKDIWYSALNILGLTTGITFSLLIIFYLKDELSFDRFNEKSDRIFRIGSFIKESGKEVVKVAVSPPMLRSVLQQDYPEVEESVRLLPGSKTLYKNGDKRFYEDKTFFCDSNMFRVFTHRFIEGNPQTALTDPNSMVLTRSVAERFFGQNEQAVGQSLQNDNGETFKITGVIEDVPRNAHLRFNILIPLHRRSKEELSTWSNFFTYTYVLLRPNASIQKFDTKLPPICDEYLAPIFAISKVSIQLITQPITEIHLHSDLLLETEELGSISYIYVFSAIAFFLLIIACINYMNLATARSARRAKEIGIRKVVGSTRSSLVVQFLSESVLNAFLALLISILLFILLLSPFNLLTGKSIGMSVLLEPGTILILLAIVLFVGLMGGLYPALYLSGFSPIGVLKGLRLKNSGNAVLRRTLVVVQFSISMIMLICTWIVYGQLNYLRNKDVGFNKEQVLSLPINTGRDVRGSITYFKNELAKNPHVLSAGTSEFTPGQETSYLLYNIRTKEGLVQRGIDSYAIDSSYFRTLNIQMKEGRGFSGSDTMRRIIVNESLVKTFGWDHPIGERISYTGGGDPNAYFEVIGVMKDFHQKSLYNPIAPLFVVYRPQNANILVKLDAKDIPSAISSVETLWKSTFPELPFSYTFLDQDFNSQYKSDQVRGRIFIFFSALTILITCLGLLGLVAFTTEQRQKEIGIRKVMGAGLREIIPLITANFVLLVGISCFIAFPVAYLFMDKWLKVFPYNTGLSAMPFLVSAIVILVITLLTVIFHTVRVAIANPAKSLAT